MASFTLDVLLLNKKSDSIFVVVICYGFCIILIFAQIALRLLFLIWPDFVIYNDVCIKIRDVMPK